MKPFIGRLCVLMGLALALVPISRAAAEPASSTAASSSAVVQPATPEAEPQLLRGVNESGITAMTTLIVFLVLVVVLGKFAWGPIVAGLRKREEGIRKDIADAEAARARAEAMLKQYNDQLAAAETRSREMVSAATVQGEKLAMQIRMTAQKEAQEITERATREIEAAREAAVRDVQNQAAELSTLIASKIIRRNLNPQDQADLVREGLEQLQAIGTN